MTRILVNLQECSQGRRCELKRSPPQLGEIKIISSAGARVLADACSGLAEQNKQVVAIAMLDGEDLIESDALEGAPMNAVQLFHQQPLAANAVPHQIPNWGTGSTGPLLTGGPSIDFSARIGIA